MDLLLCHLLMSELSSKTQSVYEITMHRTPHNMEPNLQYMSYQFSHIGRVPWVPASVTRPWIRRPSLNPLLVMREKYRYPTYALPGPSKRLLHHRLRWALNIYAVSVINFDVSRTRDVIRTMNLAWSRRPDAMAAWHYAGRARQMTYGSERKRKSAIWMIQCPANLLFHKT